MEPFKAELFKLASGTSFVIGTNFITMGIWGFIGGCACYFLGYHLMGKYKKIN